MGEKNPGLTVSLLRQIFTKLLQRPRPSARDIAATVSKVLRRTEESRIYHWLQKTRKFPPPRPKPGPAPKQSFSRK